MTDTEAQAEVVKRWGAAGQAIRLSAIGYLVGHTYTPPGEQEPIIQIHGVGVTWEVAFAQADSVPCIPYWTPTAAGFACPPDRHKVAA
jgi:hypothetical protein